jgi:hypothetical protein
MLFREIIVVCFESHMKPISILCGQDVVILILKHVVNIATTVL